MPSGRAGAARFLELAYQYAAAGNKPLEALCHYQRARLLRRGGEPADEAPLGESMLERRKECAEEYERAATLYDEVGLIKESGRSWHRAAYEYHWLARLYPKYRERCYAVCNVAADRLEAADDWWGKGLSEQIACLTLRGDKLGDPPDPRALPMLCRSAHSFARAGRHVEAAASLMSAAVMLIQAGSDEKWMAIAVHALRSYEEARPGLQMPHDRAQNDLAIIANGARVLTTKVCKTSTAMGEHPMWAELVWLLEQAPKARSFQDQHIQDEAWVHLVASDETLRGLLKSKDELTREHDGLDRKITAVLFSKRSTEELRAMGNRLQKLEEQLDKSRRQVEERLKELARARSDRVEIFSAAPVFPEELQKLLNPGEAYIGYRWNDGAPLRTLVTQTTFTAGLAHGVFSGYAHQTVDAALGGETLSNTDPDDAARLIGSIPDGIDTLIISPESLLVGLPWHLLPTPIPTDPKLTLGDLYTIAIVPAAGILRRSRSTCSKHEHSVIRDAAYMGVACDGRGSGHTPLRFVDGEVEAVIRNYFAGDQRSICLTTSDCHRFLDGGCNARLLHLACHAERSGILLSHNGAWITPTDLINRPERTFGADVILLTGCYAGDFSRDENNEFLGVVRQLIVVTGARAAIASIAPIPDPAGPVFADLIVSALTGHNPGRPWRIPTQPLAVGHALAWARQTMRELSPDDVKPLIPEYPHPFPGRPSWWSPWFVVGDPSALIGGY